MLFIPRNFQQKMIDDFNSPKPMLNVGLYSLDIVDGDPDDNFRKVEDFISCCCLDVDVLVLPELFSTGFANEESILMNWWNTCKDEDCVGRLQNLSAKYGVALCGSFLGCDGEKMVNRSFFVTPSGETFLCNKRHLFGLSEESRLMNKGIWRHLSSPIMGVDLW